MLDFITINEHSSIRVDEGKIIYSDPYNINCAPHDADIILITHSHFDHYSPDDIRKVMKSDTVIVCPDTVNEPEELTLPILYRLRSSLTLSVRSTRYLSTTEQW